MSNYNLGLIKYAVILMFMRSPAWPRPQCATTPPPTLNFDSLLCLASYDVNNGSMFELEKAKEEEEEEEKD